MDYSCLSSKSIDQLYLEHRSELLLLNVLHCFSNRPICVNHRFKRKATLNYIEDNSLDFFFLV